GRDPSVIGLSGSQTSALGPGAAEGARSTLPAEGSHGGGGNGLGLIAGAGVGALGGIGYGRSSAAMGFVKGVAGTGSVGGLRAPGIGAPIIDPAELPASRPRVNPVGGVIGSESQPAARGSGMLPSGGRPTRRETRSVDRVAYEEWQVL